MKSSDGRYEVVKHDYGEIRMGSPCFGRLEIRGSSFGLVSGEFAEPVAFSPDSRFLAAAELVSTAPGPEGRVMVFDFQRGVSIMVHSFSGLARSFTWEAGGILSFTVWSHLSGEDTRRVWVAPPWQKSSDSWRGRTALTSYWLLFVFLPLGGFLTWRGLAMDSLVFIVPLFLVLILFGERGFCLWKRLWCLPDTAVR